MKKLRAAPIRTGLRSTTIFDVGYQKVGCTNVLREDEERARQSCCSQFAELLLQLVVIDDSHTAIIPATYLSR